MKQETLIHVQMDWEQHWRGMPDFVQEKSEPYAQIIVRFATKEDLDSFASLIDQKLTKKTKSIWHPFKSHWGSGSNKRWISKRE